MNEDGLESKKSVRLKERNGGGTNAGYWGFIMPIGGFAC